jgi:hypothetical protein
MEHHHEPVPTSAPAGMTHDSADYEYAFTPPGAGYEHTDANVGILVKFALWLVISAVIIHVGLWAAFALFVEQREATTEAEFPLAVTSTQPRLPSAPRLQRDPATEMYEFRLQEQAVLHGYGWVDKNAGTVRIPIDEAMRLTLERGLPSRVVQPAAAPGADGTAAAEPVNPSLIPADSSGGRTMERGR